MAKASSRRRKRSSNRKSSRSGMAPWYLAAVLVIGGVVAYDHREQFTRLPATHEMVALLSQSDKKTKSARVPSQPKEHTGSIARKPSRAVPAPLERPVSLPKEPTAARPSDGATFYFCGIRHDNCVIDGDTFLFNGERILIADIDAPETKLAKCDEERSRGAHAKARLRELLNAGSFTLVESSGGFVDGEAGKRRLLMRNGKSLGEVLFAEGLVRKRASKPLSWCRPTTARVAG